MKLSDLKFNKIITFLVIAGIVLVLCAKIYETDKLKNRVESQAIEISTLNDSVSVYKSKNGELTYKISSIEIENLSAKKALEQAGFEIKELRDRNIKWRNVVAALNAKIESSGSGSTTIRDTVYIANGDTTRTKSYNWNNRFLFINGTITDNVNSFDYKYKASLSIVTESKKSESVVSIYIDDPNAEIMNANSITIKNKNHWWENKWLYGAAGLGVGYLIFK